MSSLQEREKVKLRPLLEILVLMCLSFGLVLFGVAVGWKLCDFAEARVQEAGLGDPSGATE